MNIKEALEKLNELPEKHKYDVGSMHAEADDIILSFVPDEVRQVHEMLRKEENFHYE